MLNRDTKKELLIKEKEENEKETHAYTHAQNAQESRRHNRAEEYQPIG